VIQVLQNEDCGLHAADAPKQMFKSAPHLGCIYISEVNHNERTSPRRCGDSRDMGFAQATRANKKRNTKLLKSSRYGGIQRWTRDEVFPFG
jgi:hypothetical protein